MLCQKVIVLISLAVLANGMEDQKPEHAPKSAALDLATDIMRQLKTKKGQHQSYVFSPLGIRLGLAILYEATKGETRLQILDKMGFDPSQFIFRRRMRTLINATVHPLRYEYDFGIISELFLDADIRIEKEFRDVMDEIFKQQIRIAPFHRKPESAIEFVNRMAAQKSMSYKDQFLPNNTINKDTDVLIISTGFFKTKWMTAFNGNSTELDLFESPKGHYTRVPFMKSSAMKLHVSRPKAVPATWVWLRIGHNATFVGILPDEPDGLDYVIQRVTSEYPTNEDIKANFSLQICDIWLPRMVIRSGVLSMREVLRNVGVRKVFEHDADISGIVGADKKFLNVSEFLHEVTLELYEKGVEQGAQDVETSASQTEVSSEKEEKCIALEKKIA